MSSKAHSHQNNRPLQVGDLCITINSEHPACNDGDLVTIIKIDHTINDAREGRVPYLVRRIDGLPHISTVSRDTGVQGWAKCIDAWCAAHKLKRIEPESSDAHALNISEQPTKVTARSSRSPKLVEFR